MINSYLTTKFCRDLAWSDPIWIWSAVWSVHLDSWIWCRLNCRKVSIYYEIRFGFRGCKSSWIFHRYKPKKENLKNCHDRWYFREIYIHREMKIWKAYFIFQTIVHYMIITGPYMGANTISHQLRCHCYEAEMERNNICAAPIGYFLI